MVKTLNKTVDYLLENLGGVNVKFAYEYNFLNRPVINQSVYITVDDTKLSETVNFAAYVYSPVVQGGIGCIKLAERVVVLLEKCKFLYFSEFIMSRVKYNSSSNAFIIEIKGNVFDENGSFSDSKTVPVLAFNFSKNSDFELSFSVEAVTVQRENQPYAIKAICRSAPIDIINAGTVYRIILKNVSTNATEYLGENGSFSLKITVGTDTCIYEMCCLNTDTADLLDKGKRNTLEILAYIRKAEDK